jgi:hypothetical protein
MRSPAALALRASKVRRTSEAKVLDMHRVHYGLTVIGVMALAFAFLIALERIIG